MSDNAKSPKLRLAGVTKSFVAPRTGQQTLAVAEMNLDIETGAVSYTHLRAHETG
jgi:hypothetical protein